ncbi:MAG: hypothetical protein NTV86_03705 [Planctomycetota bacterium]|nr:hypothetical protein [Planctomycetota bacterium]
MPKDKDNADIDALAAALAPILSAPCDRAIRLTGGDPGEVIVTIHPYGIEVQVFTVEWRDPGHPVVVGEPFAALLVSNYPDTSALLDAARKAIADARAKRLETYRLCEHCGRMKPPEWMHDDRTCQGCAERDFGVVY